MGYISRYLNNQLTEEEQLRVNEYVKWQEDVNTQIIDNYNKDAEEFVTKLINDPTNLNKLSEYLDMPVQEVVLGLKELYK